MNFTKPSPGLVEEFKAAIGPIRDGQPRKMFGYDCVFVNGNFAAGLWRNTVVFKLSAEDGARITAKAGAIPFAPMKGRPMKGWYEARGRLPRRRAAHRMVRAGGGVRAIPTAQVAESRKGARKEPCPTSKAQCRSDVVQEEGTIGSPAAPGQAGAPHRSTPRLRWRRGVDE